MKHGAPKSPLQLMYRVYKYVLPEVEHLLDGWTRRAEAIPDRELRTQALASIASKKFHCQGGAVYAAASLNNRHVLTPLIVALQTISDYLDNLCDRSTSLDPDDFRLLHQSMLDAVDLDATPRDYYALRREHDDGGYLLALVETCRGSIAQLPSYLQVKRQVIDLVGLYADLQVHKHIRKDLREPRLLKWWEEKRHSYPHLQWNEFAAATGSTLGMFMLFLAAAHTGLQQKDADMIRDAYFPHVCGLHILLDYLIDQEEDRQGGDLNFCNYYVNQSEMVNRIGNIVQNAREDVRVLPAAPFHRMVIEGLLALYLSDPKVRKQRDVKRISRQLMRKSPLTRVFFWLNSVYIRAKQYRLSVG
ncbi:tetraprenyl-beta-curcumene synthase family protein [Paenibacillus sp. GCM10012307]|uniref:Tetraprenyl-beta-curcumene synthase family protein n=1 Tax=Paenibacillus roseus TaxID=2798579 RepID=A0A934IZC1_9BACL|nr:tetraprenyl-beta-curcumene synthase family protein [Paenibacillus roseus]MBJ6359835.1 tetraprenyl-beta-curcumene synthase family protein [Paenibacillus roseus]